MKSFLVALVRLFPSGFRSQFAADIREQVLADYDRARAAGRLRALLFSVATGLDLTRSGLAERWDPTWTTAATSPDKKGIATMLNHWINDLRYGARALRRAPGFTAVTVVTLGLAIGANVGIFTIVDAVLLNPLPFPDPDRLVHIAASAPGSDLPAEFGVGVEFFLQYSEQSELLADVSTYSMFTNTLRAVDRTERVWMAISTPSLFSTLQASPLIGRLPVVEDASRVVVISHQLWTTWFAADPDIIGKTCYAGGVDRTIIGVMEPGFWFPDKRVLLWIPNVIRAEGLVPGRFGASLVGRMEPGVEAEALATELTGLARRLPERFGGSARYGELLEQHRAVVRSADEQLVGSVAGPLWILLGSVIVVLLIACANVGNLFLVRAEHRQRDLAVRRALGAGRIELVRAQIAEALVIAGAAGMLAVLLAWLTVPLFLKAAPPNVPRLDEVGLGATALLVVVGLSLVSALACGMAPAIRSSSPRLTRLRDGGGRRSTHARHWGRDGLVVAQTALALVLLIGSGLLVRSFWALRDVDPGYDTRDVFTFQIAPEGDELRDAATYARFHLDFMERLAALPGVVTVGLVENVPLNEGVSSVRFSSEEAALREEGTGDQDGGVLLGQTWAAGNYFGAMGIDVMLGRGFTEADHVSDLGNVIVSRAAADLLWPAGGDPVGKRIRFNGADTWETVVGVVEDVLQFGFRDRPQPLVYLPLVGQSETVRPVTSPAFVLKTPRAEQIAPEVLALVREVAPEAPMYRVFTMAGLAAESMVQLSFTTLTLGIASALALVLGAIGLFGVLSYVVAERTREIGVRMALGAEAKQVRRMVVAQGSRLLAIGVVLGVGAAAASTQVLGSLLFGVEAADVVTFVGMSATMVLVGLLASYMPARRASNVDPIESLRGE